MSLSDTNLCIRQANTKVIAIGTRAGYYTTSDSNVYIGGSAGRENRKWPKW